MLSWISHRDILGRYHGSGKMRQKIRCYTRIYITQRRRAESTLHLHCGTVTAKSSSYTTNAGPLQVQNQPAYTQKRRTGGRGRTSSSRPIAYKEPDGQCVETYKMGWRTDLIRPRQMRLQLRHPERQDDLVVLPDVVPARALVHLLGNVRDVRRDRAERREQLCEQGR